MAVKFIFNSLRQYLIQQQVKFICLRSQPQARQLATQPPQEHGQIWINPKLAMSIKRMEYNVEQIAEICHEANRAYCNSIGDFSQPSWIAAPSWQCESAINGVKFHLAALDRGEDPKPSTSHENWLEEKRRDGWTYGPVKNADTKEHPCFMPYDGLPLEQRLKDYIFAGIVKAIRTAIVNEK